MIFVIFVSSQGFAAPEARISVDATVAALSRRYALLHNGDFVRRVRDQIRTPSFDGEREPESELDRLDAPPIALRPE
jgi:hypothetical protein